MLRLLRLLSDPNASGRQFCTNFFRLCIIYCIFSIFMIWFTYNSYKTFSILDKQFALRIAILSGLQAASYFLKAVTLYPLSLYNDILNITYTKVLVAILFSTLAFLLLLVRYGYEFVFLTNENDDSTAASILPLVISFIIIIVTNGNLLSILSIILL